MRGRRVLISRNKSAEDHNARASKKTMFENMLKHAGHFDVMREDILEAVAERKSIYGEDAVLQKINTLI